MLQQDRIPVIVIFAPTATGKTALALDFFGEGSHSFFKGKGELISADSMQVYKKLDIGTAKPSDEEKRLLPHHLIDLIDYSKQFTVSDFVEMADKKAGEIWARGKIPLVVGGTAFYIRNFLLGQVDTPASDSELRERLKNRWETEGKDVLYRELSLIDPESAEKINENDCFRVCRALEVFYLTGKKRSSFSQKETLREQYDFLTIILERNRDSLYSRIEERVDQMFSLGLEEEVRKLKEEGADENMPGMKAIGYREWFLPNLSTEEIRHEIKRSSKKYAKKQYTIMKDIPGAVRISVDDEKKSREELFKLISDFLSKYGFTY